jgi:protein-tyrosine phosphatase
VTNDRDAGGEGHLSAIEPRPSVDTLTCVSTVTAEPLPERLIALEAVHNFRDLGGYTTTDGRVTRWQMLYRADGLHRLTGADVAALRQLGLRTVVDLRTDKELDERGTFPVDAYPVTFHHLPVIDVTWDPNTGDDADAAEFLFRQYESMLAYGEPLFAKAFHLLGLPGALPAVFHCAAGKDRTGILAALILSSLGVPADVVAEDYGLSRAAMVRMRAWATEHNPELAAAWDKAASSHLAAEPEAMAKLLTTLTERHGSVREYVVSLGVSNALLVHLESALLADAE